MGISIILTCFCVSQPKRLPLMGVRSTHSSQAAQRENVFNKEWVYLNLQSETGCTVTVHVTSKSESMPIKSPMKTPGADGTATGGFGSVAANTS